MDLVYEDEQIEMSKCHILIRKYYFPLATSKTILFSDVESVSLFDSEGLSLVWGVSAYHLNSWFPLDAKRAMKHKYLEIKLKNKKIKPCITPNDPVKVFNLINSFFFGKIQKNQQKKIAQEKNQEKKNEENMIQRYENSEMILNYKNDKHPASSNQQK